MDKYFMWINYERLHNHNKAKHSKTVCIFLGIHCRVTRSWFSEQRSDIFNVPDIWGTHTWLPLSLQLILALTVQFQQQPWLKKMKHYFEVYLAYNNCHSCWFDVILLNHWQYITRHRGNSSVYLIWFVTYSIWHVLIKSISGRLIPLSCLKSYWSILIMDLHFISLLGLNLLPVVETHHQGRQTPAESKNQYHELWTLVLTMREALSIAKSSAGISLKILFPECVLLTKMHVHPPTHAHTKSQPMYGCPIFKLVLTLWQGECPATCPTEFKTSLNRDPQ